jgi:glucosylceramidase
MHPTLRRAAALALCLAGLGLAGSHLREARAAGEVVSVWLTTSDRAQLLAPQAALAFAPDSGTQAVTIDVDEAQRFQTMDGFGASLTDASAWLIWNRMSASQRATLLDRLFSTGSGIGLSVLRQPMGGSDFSLVHYNYDNTCCDLGDFSIGYETPYIVPLLRQIRTVNPDLLIMGSPWSPPGWMKTSGSMIGGSLLPQHYPTLASYFVRWIQAYQAQGLPIYAVTPQNEPQFSPGDYPGMLMSAGEQANFVKNNLGPALRSAGLATKIIVFDHNWDIGSYATSVLNDGAAKSFAAGSGFHCYGGNVSAQTATHDAHPDRDIWHTECSDGTWIGGGSFAALFDRDMREMVIGVVRNWGKGTTKWNLALDTANGPHRGGCSTCFGTVTIDQGTGAVAYNAEYYALGHASKFVRRGARRIASNTFAGGIETVAFLNPDGGKALVVYNAGAGSATFRVRWTGQSFRYTLAGRAAATFTWNTSSGGGGISPAAWYNVVNSSSGKCVDEANWGTAPGTAVQQWACGTGQHNQQWQFTPTSNGYYRVSPRFAPGLAWDVTGVSAADGATAQLWTYGGGNNQQWLAQSAGGGVWRFVARHSGKCLDVPSASTADGARLQQWACNSSGAQSFRLVAQQ